MRVLRKDVYAELARRRRRAQIAARHELDGSNSLGGRVSACGKLARHSRRVFHRWRPVPDPAFTETLPCPCRTGRSCRAPSGTRRRAGRPSTGCSLQRLPDGVIRHDHRLLESRVDDVGFVGAVNEQPAFFVRQRLAGQLLDAPARSAPRRSPRSRFCSRPNRTCDRFFSHSKYDTVTPPAFA